MVQQREGKRDNEGSDPERRYRYRNRQSTDWFGKISEIKTQVTGAREIA